jgi:hypothetical protein
MSIWSMSMAASYKDCHPTRAIFPDKANSVLVIDPDAVLAAPIAMQGFQPISRRRLEIIDCVRRIEHFQFPQRRALNGL